MLSLAKIRDVRSTDGENHDENGCGTSRHNDRAVSDRITQFCLEHRLRRIDRFVRSYEYEY